VSVSVTKFDENVWEEGRPRNVEVGTAGGNGVSRRKWLSQGDLGMFAQWVQMPPGNIVHTHSHDRDEFMVVLSGGCRFQGDVDLGPGDAATVPAGSPYGFVVGDDGMVFLILRTDEATLSRG
jgi:quercetin dioxygenase-like cupin family protein